MTILSMLSPIKVLPHDVKKPQAIWEQAGNSEGPHHHGVDLLFFCTPNCRMISNKTCAVSNNIIDFIRNDKYDLYHSLIWGIYAALNIKYGIAFSGKRDRIAAEY